MVSTLRYYSFKDFDLRSRQSYMTILFLALLFVAIGSHPQTMFLAMAGAYMMSGPLIKTYSLLRRTQLKTESTKDPLPTPPAPEELDG
jgi:CDP-diacylglycerol--serine O-phosphatidyltransferase